jgi:hypothetical protein
MRRRTLIRVDDIWELYHVDEDPTESYDVSAQFPEKQGPRPAARGPLPSLSVIHVRVLGHST